MPFFAHMIDMKDKIRHAKHAMSRRKEWVEHDGYWGWEYVEEPEPARKPAHPPNRSVNGYSGPDEFVIRNRNNVGEHSGYNGFDSRQSPAGRSQISGRDAPALNGSASGLSSGSLPKQTQTIRMGDEPKVEQGHVDPPFNGTGKPTGGHVPSRNPPNGEERTKSEKTSASMSRAEKERSMSRSQTVRVPNIVPKFVETPTFCTLSNYDLTGIAIWLSASVAAGGYTFIDFTGMSGAQFNVNRSGYLGTLGCPGDNAGADFGAGTPFGRAYLDIDNFSSGTWRISVDIQVSCSAAMTPASWFGLVVGDFSTIAGSQRFSTRYCSTVAAGVMQSHHFDIVMPLRSMADCPFVAFKNGGAGATTISLYSMDCTAMKMGDL